MNDVKDDVTLVREALLDSLAMLAASRERPFSMRSIGAGYMSVLAEMMMAAPNQEALDEFSEVVLVALKMVLDRAVPSDATSARQETLQ